MNGRVRLELLDRRRDAPHTTVQGGVQIQRVYVIRMAIRGTQFSLYCVDWYPKVNPALYFRSFPRSCQCPISQLYCDTTDVVLPQQAPMAHPAKIEVGPSHGLLCHWRVSIRPFLATLRIFQAWRKMIASPPADGIEVFRSNHYLAY